MSLIYNKKILIVILLIVLVIVVNNFFIDKNTTLKNKNLIRLHIIANSDRVEDQNLKKKIRDRIIIELGNEFSSLNNLSDARNTIKNNISLIENIALCEIKKNNKDYPVKAALDNCPFPTKWYGNFILPAGNYEALKVVLGEGKGSNWWCVLFPPLCFVDISSSFSENPQELNELLKKYNNDSVKINIKIKILEIINEKINKIKDMS
jgi:stage II sporulation protein R